METQEYIPIDVFCQHHGVTISFISSLQHFGLIEVIRINDAECLPADQLGEAEKILRLHNELEINLEGIDAIRHLLQRVKDMQDEIRLLKNRLSLYE
ncbi:MAG: MerR family transcriptional regulator [Sediminibacterium sp.]|nr:MerR family transcriptional regulator [Sediminibacterium sp.]